uniref:Uncharacterized protein n=1 Tax=Anguilla anguilla TaxID=7936 RepID=A0A0E9WLM0_ANGAN
MQPFSVMFLGHTSHLHHFVLFSDGMLPYVSSASYGGCDHRVRVHDTLRLLLLLLLLRAVRPGHLYCEDVHHSDNHLLLNVVYSCQFSEKRSVSPSDDVVDSILQGVFDFLFTRVRISGSSDDSQTTCHCKEQGEKRHRKLPNR